MALVAHMKTVVTSNTLLLRKHLSGLAMPPSLEISVDRPGILSFKLIDAVNEFGGSLSNFESRRFGCMLDSLFTGKSGDEIYIPLTSLEDPVACPAMLSVKKTDLGLCVIGIQESTPGSIKQTFNISAYEWYSYAVLLKAVADIDIMNIGG